MYTSLTFGVYSSQYYINKTTIEQAITSISNTNFTDPTNLKYVFNSNFTYGGKLRQLIIRNYIEIRQLFDF